MSGSIEATGVAARRSQIKDQIKASFFAGLPVTPSVFLAVKGGE